MASYRYRSSRILPVILIIVIVIITVVAIVALGRALFFVGNSAPTTSQTQDAGRQALLNTGGDHSVQMTVRGPIVANENFNSYRITISPTGRSFISYVGYQNNLVDETNLDNNTAAYTQFVYALDKANLAKGTDDQSDVRGICAVGRLYQFDILQNGKSVKTLWTSTCGGSPGNLRANVEQLSSLFNVQIPNANKLINKLAL